MNWKVALFLFLAPFFVVGATTALAAGGGADPYSGTACDTAPVPVKKDGNLEKVDWTVLGNRTGNGPSASAADPAWTSNVKTVHGSAYELTYEGGRERMTSPYVNTLTFVPRVGKLVEASICVITAHSEMVLDASGNPVLDPTYGMPTYVTVVDSAVWTTQKATGKYHTVVFSFPELGYGPTTSYSFVAFWSASGKK